MALKFCGNGQNLLQKPSKWSNGKKEKISHVLATDYCHESIQHNLSAKFLQPEMTNIHELTLLISFEVITLKTTANNVSKQINDKSIKICKYVKRCRHVI